MPAAEKLAGLRQSLAALTATDRTFEAERGFTFGFPDMDRAAGGCLPAGALHDVYAAGAGDAPAASGFALAMLLRAAGRTAPLLWVRQNMAAREFGELYPPGLAEFGADPSMLLGVRVKDALAALRAGHEGLRCPALGGVAVEVWGEPKALDLTASLRLSRAAEEAGIPVLLVRVAAGIEPNAAFSRWRVCTVPSQALAASAPGFPAFEVELLRHRAGLPARKFRVEWDRDECRFRAPAHSRAVAAPSVHRSAPAARTGLRRAG